MNNLYLNAWGGVGSKTLTKNFGTSYYVWHTHWPKLPILQPSYNGEQNEFEPIINEDTKVLYIYGNPYNALLSYYRRSQVDKTWIQRHCKDLNGRYSEINPNWSVEDYLNNGEDLLGLEPHLDTWLDAKVNYDILFVEFENMWNNLELIFNYLKIDKSYINTFPPMKVRASDWTNQSENIQNKLQTLYGELYDKVKQNGTIVKGASK